MTTSTTATRGKLISLKKEKAPPRKRESVAKHILIDWEPDEKERYAVKMMIAGGMKLDDIAKCIHPQGPISPATLRRKFAGELKEGKADITKQVVSVCTQMALSGKYPAVTMFWLKAQAGWKDSGGGLNIGHTKFGTNLSITEDITQRLQKTAKSAAETLPKRKTGTGD